MSASVFDHPWLSDLFGDPEIQALWEAGPQMAHLVAFEHALTAARGACGEIEGAELIEALAALEAYQPDLDALNSATRRNGVVVPELVRQMREGLAAPKAIHTGATSQDVIDTAMVLTLRDVAVSLDARLAEAVAGLSALETRFGAVEIMGRTRMQAALPITAGHRIATWRAPLESCRDRLETVSQKVFALQLGGPVGTRESLGPNAPRITAHMAQSLNLGAPASSWHSMRDGIADYGHWLALITGTLGKMGQDICLMAQQGIGEIGMASGGASSAMPHKQNPVLAELLVTLARFNAGQQGLLLSTMLHEQERSGASWALEWMTLPQMTVTTGAALRSAVELIGKIERIGAIKD